MVKNPPANAGDIGSIPGQEDSLGKEMAVEGNLLQIPAWKIPWTESLAG